ncbi:hypothetical protein ACIHFD_49490 [Nonomuraea sp. NPDC051941]|uniref:hypothetical protein n=1 Tax=Nonomuraea sp. NPDC051941 TaxID=3364373 RepID=UPI0037C8ED23
MLKTRVYDTETGEPVVVLVAEGTHDVSCLVGLLNGGCSTSEHRDLAGHVNRQIRRNNGGRDALRLLAAHGGPDLLTPADETPPMFDVRARVPELDASEKVAALQMAKAYAASALRAYAQLSKTFPPNGAPRASYHRWNTQISAASGMYSIAHLLRALHQRLPDQADAIANELWQAMCGEWSERAYAWLANWGIDPAPIIAQAKEWQEIDMPSTLLQDLATLVGRIARAGDLIDEYDGPEAANADHWKWVNVRDALAGVLEPVHDGGFEPSGYLPTPTDATKPAGEADFLTAYELALRHELRFQDGVRDERNDHPDGTDRAVYEDLARGWKREVAVAAARGQITWKQLLLERVYAVLAEDTPDRIHRELLTLAGVAMRWWLALERRTAPAVPPADGEPVTADAH